MKKREFDHFGATFGGTVPQPRDRSSLHFNTMLPCRDQHSAENRRKQIMRSATVHKKARI